MRERLEGTVVVNNELTERLHEHLERVGLLPAGRSICVALSGGLDSVVLVHLLAELQTRWGWRLSAAHFDHRMRENSDRDARWVRSLCDDLGVPLRAGRASRVPSSEAEARRMRYAFLFQARRDLRTELLATAHHADDQAETVLFRLHRGTGLRGAAGIPAQRDPGVVRPLLRFWRSELEAYARERQLAWLEDPTNEDPSYTRNWIRHHVLPELERGRPHFRKRLYLLAALSRRATRRLDKLLEQAEEQLIIESSEGRVVVARTELLAYDTSALGALLRHLVAGVGPRPGRAGTLAALEFIKSCSSGRRIELPGGVELRREFDRLIIQRTAPADKGVDTRLSLRGAEAGEGLVRIGGCRWRVSWTHGESRSEVDGEGERARFATDELQGPLTVRCWLPGDRIRLGGGTRKLKKVFGDRKVGLTERHQLPIVADESGVLWIPGLVRGIRAQPGDEDRRFTVRVSRE